MSGFGYALGGDAVQAFTSLPSRQRGELLRLFASVARFPAQRGDFREPGASGRIYEVKLSGDLLVTWWVDHAAREVRIVRIEAVD